MATLDFSDYTLYRLRYIIGYTLVGLLLAALLVFAGSFVPGGISANEMTSVVRSESLSFADPNSFLIANMPFYALQAAIFAVAGVSIFTIKLPALLLALLSAVGFILLLRRWFKPNIAVLASLIAISTGQFLYIAQQGTPAILYVFWPIALLLLGTQITRGKHLRILWKILFVIVAALSLYTPLSIYSHIAIILTIALHPHLRNAVRRLSRVKISISATIFALLVAPLVWGVISQPQLGLTLLGIPTDWPPNIIENSMIVLQQYFFFWGTSSTALMTPVFGLGSVLLIGLGLYRLILTREATRSYLVIIWLICLTPILVLNPLFTSVTFIPSMLLLAAGLTSLISYWYRLFPRNPYARVAGLVPIVILVFALIATGLSRYIYGYHYSPQVVPLFSNDLRILPKDTQQLIVSEQELPFFTAVASYRDTLKVVTVPTEELVTVTRAARQQIPVDYEIIDIITSSRSSEADRLYIYKKTAE